MKEAVIVAALRTAVGKAPSGMLRETRPDEMAAAVIAELTKRVTGLKPEEIEDVIIGCAFPEAEQGLNMARAAALRAGLPYTVPGQTVNRFCSSGLQTIALAAERIMSGFADVIIAGGAESMSMVPIGGNTYAPDPYRPQVRLLFDREGRRRDIPCDINLWDAAGRDDLPSSVIAPLDPRGFGIDPLTLL